MYCETFGQTIQLTVEYKERDVSDDEQIVEEDEHDESEDEEDGEPEEEEDGEPEEEEDEEPEEEEDEEPEGGEDEEKNPWVGIREDVEEQHKKKLEALITEFQKSGDSEEVAAVKAYNSLLPLYREDLKDVLLEELKWIRALKKDPIYREVVATRDELMEEKGYDWLESTQLAIHERRFLLNRLFKEQRVPGE